VQQHTVTMSACNGVCLQPTACQPVELDLPLPLLGVSQRAPEGHPGAGGPLLDWGHVVEALNKVSHPVVVRAGRQAGVNREGKESSG
jgi:hypothetical protein